MTRDDGGSATLLVMLLLPLLITVVAGVAQIGALRVVAARVASAADLATLAAVDDQDDGELVRSGALRLSADAAGVARRYFALNLAQIAGLLDVTPEAAAAQADVAAFADAPAYDPLLARSYARPTVRISAAVPVRAPALAMFLLPATTVVNVRAVSSPR